MSIRDRVVYGERVGDLLPALAAVRDAMTIAPDGRYHFSVTLEPSVGLPFRRAFMRAEAELLLEDASASSTSQQDRTYEQRAADALLRLVRAIAGKLTLAPSE